MRLIPGGAGGAMLDDPIAGARSRGSEVEEGYGARTEGMTEGSSLGRLVEDEEGSTPFAGAAGFKRFFLGGAATVPLAVGRGTGAPVVVVVEEVEGSGAGGVGALGGQTSPRASASALAASLSQTSTSMLTLTLKSQRLFLCLSELTTHLSPIQKQLFATFPNGSHLSVAKLMLSAQLKPKLNPE